MAHIVFAHGGGAAIHFWNTGVRVGDGELAYRVGDDVCPGTNTGVKGVLGSGTLSAEHPRLVVVATQGSSPCVDGTLGVWSGPYVDLWVEDPRPECAGRDIHVASYYQTADFEELWYWPTTMTPMHSITVPGDRGSLLVLASAEGTIELSPNSECGSEAATLVLQTLVDGAVLSQTTEVIPASGGMGHLVLSAEATTTAGTSVELRLGSNTSASPVFTGGCCGDAVLAVVQLP